MADTINVTIQEQSISATLGGGMTWLNFAVQTVPFAIPLAIDVTNYKDWKCTSVSGDTTLNITGEADGDAGMIETYNSASGIITLGTMFTKNAGGGILESAVSGDNIIAWTKSGTDIIFSILQVE